MDYNVNEVKLCSLGELEFDDKEFEKFKNKMTDCYNNWMEAESEEKERKSNRHINRLRELGV